MATQSLHEATIHVPDSPTILKNRSVVGMFNSFEWMICNPLPVRLRDAQAVSLGDKLYVGGDITSPPGDHDHLNFIRDASRLYVYTPESDIWKTIDTPVYWFALATYHSQLVLVGGREYNRKYSVDLCTNKLWTLNELNISDHWEPLKPMNVRRYMPSAVSHEDYLLVAGGGEDDDDLELDIADLLNVEVYDGSCWSTAHQPLPVNPGSYMKSACLAGYWYLGGFEDDKGIYFASLDSLIASCTCEMPLSSTIWQRLPDIPDFWSVIPVVFANRLIALGASSTIYALSAYSWKTVGDLRLPMNCICALTMRSGDLIVVGGEIDDPNAANIVLKATASSNYLHSAILGLKDENVKLKGENKKLMDQLSSLSPSKPVSATWNLRGVEVCGEMTVVVYSSHDQQISWPGYGLRLHIPKGCLPAGMEQCTINIKASLAGQYEFPETSHLVSAVFWLRCEDVYKFTKLITVEIEHCAKSLKLNFFRAVCSQKQLPYTFKQLPGGNFTSHSSYGAIDLNSFSGVGITQEGSEERQYYSKLFYLSNYFGGHRIDLAISWNTEAHINAVKKHYNGERALPGPDQPVQFEGEEIRLEFPMEETKINDMWTIVPLIDPVVTKSEVDSYHPGTRLPHCELEAHPIEGKPVTRLVHKLLLLGAKPPRNKFTLSYMPPSVSEASLVQSPLTSSVASEAATIPELRILLRELRKVANEWEDIGIELAIEEGQLRQIKSDNAGDSKACLREMLRVWLSRVAPPPSWSAMADALDTLGHEDVATHLKTVYIC